MSTTEVAIPESGTAPSNRVAHTPRSDEGGCVFIVASSLLANLVAPLARTFARDRGCRSVLVGLRERDLPNPRFFDFDRGAFSEIALLEPHLRYRRAAELPDLATLAARAEEVERRLDLRVLELMRGDRHVGIDFVTGVWFHRSRYGKAGSFAQKLDMILRLLRVCEDLIERHRPELVIGYPGTIHSAALIAVAERRGVPMRMLWPPRRDNFFVWIADRYGWPAGFRDIYETEFARLRAAAPTDADDETDEPRNDTPTRVLMLRERWAKEATLGHLVRQCYRQIRNNLPERIRHPAIRYGDYIIADRVRQTVQGWRLRRRAMRERPLLPDLAPDQPFVFFPLHMEPESSLLTEAYRADNQLTLIDWLAKTLPAGWLLVIKEHPAQGSYRSSGFWTQVRQYPNVRLAAALESAEAILERARAVAVINSTVGFQAAIRGVSVITFHQYYLPIVLPQVWFADSYETTARALREIRDGRGPDAPTRRLAARAFFKAMERFEFPITQPDMLAGRPGRSAMAEDEYETMVARLFESLPPREEGVRDAG